jgi:hypothetical protein
MNLNVLAGLDRHNGAAGASPGPRKGIADMPAARLVGHACPALFPPRTRPAVISEPSAVMPRAARDTIGTIVL